MKRNTVPVTTVSQDDNQQWAMALGGCTMLTPAREAEIEARLLTRADQLRLANAPRFVEDDGADVDVDNMTPDDLLAAIKEM